jgi:hypothetical protein
MAAALGQAANSVPAFLLCGEMVTGFDDEAGIGDYLRRRLVQCHEQGLATRHTGAGATSQPVALPPLRVPLLGQIDAQSTSLALLTVVIAALDAFNPCAFFVLLFLLSLLVHAHARWRMAVVGGVFVACSGLIYFAFMAAWLNAFLLFGELRVVTMAAGLLAVAMGLMNLKDFYRPRLGVSLSIPESAKPRLYQRIRGLVSASRLPAVLAGAVVLAIAANSYELLCTAGLPMLYTRILTLSALPTGGYYAYLALYNVIYVVPLAIIVAVFTMTLGSRKLREEEGRALKLLSGVMMLSLGILLLAAPQLLSNVLTAIAILALAIAVTAVAWWLGRRRATRA